MSARLKTIFAANLRAAMREQGCSSNEVARRAKLHYVTVSRILHGRISPSLSTCERLAAAVGLPLEAAFSQKKMDIGLDEVKPPKLKRRLV